jgi:ribose transport system substrate-binding protein
MKLNQNMSGKPLRRILAVAASSAALAMVLAGCSNAPASSGPANSGDVAAAQSTVDQASQEITTWNGPTESPAVVSGKTIGLIPCAQAAEGCARLADGAAEAAKVLGWKSINIDGQGDSQHQLAAFNSLLNQGVDAIFLGSIDTSAVGDGMRRAKELGVPVITSTAANPEQYGGIATVGPDNEKAGQVLAAYVVANGGGNVGVFDNTEMAAVSARATGFRDALSTLGGATIVGDQAVALAQIGPPEQAMMSAFLQSHPRGTADWVYASFDSLLTPLVQTAQSSGRTELKALAIDGNLENLEFIRSGTVEVATVAYPLEWTGWAAMDDLNRVFAGEDVVDQNVPFRLLTKDNLPAAGQPWEGDYDFRAEYKKLWKL